MGVFDRGEPGYETRDVTLIVLKSFDFVWCARNDDPLWCHRGSYCSMGRLSIGLVVLLACDGTIHSALDDVDPEERTESGDCAHVGDQPLRRLSSRQYENTLRDLFPGGLGAELVERGFFPETHIDDGYEADAVANTINTSESNAIEDSAEELANWLLDDADTYLPQTMPCVEPGYSDADVDACRDQFVDEVGLRVYRRPLTAGERSIVIGLYDEIRGLQDAESAWSAVMQFFLQSPALLYRTERGVGDVDGSDLVVLSDWEMASRLSYFFLSSMPDDALFAAAAAGELSTPAQIEAQARRLVATPRAMEAIESFHRDWLHLHQLEDVAKSTDTFPEWGEEMRTALQSELRAFLEHQLDGDASYLSLMTTGEVPVDPALTSIYDSEAGTQTIPERMGLLTLASFAAAHATESVTNPIERGAFIRQQVLCAGLPEFPGDVDTSPLESTADQPTARQRLQPLMEREDCSACHTQFNPLGLALEQFDALGHYRTDENGTLIDTSGDIALEGVGAFADAPDLLGRIASSDAGRDCYATQWFRFVQGRREVPTDACVMRDLHDAVAASGGDVRELMVALTQTEAFRFHPALQEEAP